MNAFERRLSRRFEAIDLSAATPGVVLEVHKRGRKVGRLELGKTYPYYDLASLTKILFTASVCMRQLTMRDLDAPIAKVLPWWHRQTTPRQLLSHTAGLEWWIPMYKRLKGPLDPDARWAQMKRELRKVKPKKRKAAVYSDIDLWMTGAYLEARLAKSLLELWQDNADELDLRNMFFHPGNKPRFARGKYAPTENSPWHGRVLQGEVHDENGWALGGVAPHTGLFGTLDSVSQWGLELRKAVRGESEKFGKTSMVKHFTGRRVPRSVGDWGLCFMKPSKGRASCGKYFSARSFGHTGFTGTSLWFDPVQDLLVVVLSNRVHPTRENQAFVKLRPQIHNWIVESL